MRAARAHIWEYAAGTLDEHERAAVEVLLAESPDLRRELALAKATLGVGLEPGAPSPSGNLRSRLLTHVSGAERFAPFASRVAGLLNISVGEAREELRAASGDTGWRPGQTPGVLLRPARCGAALSASAVFVRTCPSNDLPKHRHLGTEQVLIMQGGYTDVSSGKALRAGDSGEMAAGSAHALRTHDDGECIALLVMHGPVEIE